MRVLMILIPGGDIPDAGNHPLLRLERFIGPYYAFQDAKVEVVLASPAGGFPWMGLASEDPPDSAPAVVRFRKDRTARDDLADTLSLDQICVEDFEGVLCIGAPGRIWHAADDSRAGAVIARFLGAGKPVAVIQNQQELVPFGAGEGLIITGDSAAAPVLAAQALLGAIGR